MSTQNIFADAAGRPAETLKTVTDALRTTGESAMSSHREVVGLALAQGQENVDTLFGTLKTIAAVKSPVDAAALYMRFLLGAPEKQMRQAQALGESMARSSKATWQPLADAIAAPAKTLNGSRFAAV